MDSVAEAVEFPDDAVQVLAEGAEDDRELPFLLLKVNQGSEERWNQVVLALAKHLHQELLILRDLLPALGSCLLRLIVLAALFGAALGAGVPEGFAIQNLLLDFEGEVEFL